MKERFNNSITLLQGLKRSLNSLRLIASYDDWYQCKYLKCCGNQRNSSLTEKQHPENRSCWFNFDENHSITGIIN